MRIRVRAAKAPAAGAPAVAQTSRRRLRAGSPYVRRWLLSIVLLLWAAGVAAELLYLQVERHDDFVAKAARQQRAQLELKAPRGTIYDARGRELAVSVKTESVYADPSEVEDQGATVARLGRALGMSASEREHLRGLLARDRNFVYVKRKLEPEQVLAVRALGLPGIYFQPESKRYYPLGRLAAQVLGFVGMDDTGLAGLEAHYESTIAGQTIERTVVKYPGRGYVLDSKAMAELARPGADLYLTLDASLEHLAERELRRVVLESGARSGTVILLDPRDSAILAMASWPTFDPNLFQVSPEDHRRNRAVMDAYEPGSTFKVITAAAVLENLVLHQDDTIDCEQGGLTVGRRYIRDHKPFGILSFRQVLEQSSNVGAMKAALLTGSEPLYRTARGFGLGQRTGVDLPAENAGQMHGEERWRDREFLAYASFGQGVAVTPLQLANVFATIANGGVVHEPYLVRAIGRGENIGENIGENTHPQRQSGAAARAISGATAQTLLRLLEGVVENGTGKAAAIRGYRVAGKTGTAEKTSHQGVSGEGRLAYFVGIAPAREPRLVGLVMIDEPHGEVHGGQVAAPLFGALVGEALLYLGVAPTSEPSDKVSTDVALAGARWLTALPLRRGPVAPAAPRPDREAGMVIAERRPERSPR